MKYNSYSTRFETILRITNPNNVSIVTPQFSVTIIRIYQLIPLVGAGFFVAPKSAIPMEILSESFS